MGDKIIKPKNTEIENLEVKNCTINLQIDITKEQFERFLEIVEADTVMNKALLEQVVEELKEIKGII